VILKTPPSEDLGVGFSIVFTKQNLFRATANLNLINNYHQVWFTKEKALQKHGKMLPSPA